MNAIKSVVGRIVEFFRVFWPWTLGGFLLWCVVFFLFPVFSAFVETRP